MHRRDRQGFTLVELLVVIGIVGVLATFLLPVVAKAKLKAQGVQCLNNTRQLALGWLMYADDHDSWLCPNGGAPRQGWVDGIMNFDTNFADNTNTAYLVNLPHGKLGPYVRSSAVYRCPADKSFVRVDRKTYPRVRTLAMNDAVGSNAEGTFLPRGAGWRTYRKMGDITAPTPASLWLLVEQHPDSINDGRFAVDCQSRNSTGRWIDFPANFHNRAATFSFADGHAEMRKWVDEQTLPPNKYCGCLSHYASEGHFTACPNSPDLAWLQERTSARRN